MNDFQFKPPQSPIERSIWTAPNASSNLGQPMRQWNNAKYGGGNATQRNLLLSANRSGGNGSKASTASNGSGNRKMNMHQYSSQRDLFTTDDTYEMGIAKDMRELELRLESELEEHEKTWSQTDDTTLSQN